MQGGDSTLGLVFFIIDFDFFALQQFSIIRVNWDSKHAHILTRVICSAIGARNRVVLPGKQLQVKSAVLFSFRCFSVTAMRNTATTTHMISCL